MTPFILSSEAQRSSREGSTAREGEGIRIDGTSGSTVSTPVVGPGTSFGHLEDLREHIEEHRRGFWSWSGFCGRNHAEGDKEDNNNGAGIHHCGDFFECDWREASVLLVNSTGFDDNLMARVTAKVQSTNPGTRVITLSQPLPGSPPHCDGQIGPTAAPPGFELLSQSPYRMTWGNATVYIYRHLVDI